MKLSEYLARRNPTVKSLTNAEKKAIGIKDFSKGWAYRYADYLVPEELAYAIMTGPKPKKVLKSICRGELSFPNIELDKEYKAILQQD